MYGALLERFSAGVFALAMAGSALTMTPSPTLAQTVVVGSEGAIPPLDPHRMTGSPGLRVIAALYDPLIREDLSKSSEAAPDLRAALAESWSVSEDGLVYRFILREAVKFHDGSELDAAAVKANFERFTDKGSPLFDERAAGNMTFLTRWIDSTAVIDKRTFEIKLKEPFAGLLRLLADHRASIISPTALERFKGDEMSLHPVGTGSFMLDTFKQGEQLTLARNDHGWDGKAAIDTLVFRPILDPTAQAMAMQTGQIDIIPSANPEQIQQLSVDPNLQVQYPAPANAFFVRLNMKAEYTDNKLFRQALNYAVNRENLVALLGGYVTARGGVVPAGNELPFETGVAYDYNPEKAKQLLGESGITSPVIKIMSPNSGPGFGQASQIITLLQQDLAEVGIELETQFLEFATQVSTESPGYTADFHGSFNGWTTGADSAYWLERMFGGDQQPPKGVNRGWYENPEVDKLFASARGESDREKRLGLYREAANLIVDDAPWLFLYQSRLPRVLSPRISGIEPAPSIFIDYTRIQAK